VAHGHFYIQLAVFGQRGDVHIGVEDLHIAVADDIPRFNLSLAFCFDANGFHSGGVNFCHDLFDIQNQFGNVFLDPRDGGKFMMDTGNFNGCDRGSGQRGEQDAAQ
jgi:hypothetical protein